MQNKHKVLFCTFVAVLLLVAASAYGQVHKYFTPVFSVNCFFCSATIRTPVHSRPTAQLEAEFLPA
jgi:hypothetical protein